MITACGTIGYKRGERFYCLLVCAAKIANHNSMLYLISCWTVGKWHEVNG